MTPLLIRVPALCLAVAAVLLTLCGCETTPKTGRTSGEGEMFEVKADYTAFYRHGPQQRGGPDLSLKRNRVVKMLKRSFGFSLVEIEDGTPGYVSTEDLRPSTSPGFGNPNDGLFGLLPDPIQSSAIVERYSTGQDPGDTGLQLQPGGIPGDLLLPPEPLLPALEAPPPIPGPTPGPTPAATPAP